MAPLCPPRLRLSRSRRLSLSVASASSSKSSSGSASDPLSTLSSSQSSMVVAGWFARGRALGALGQWAG
eukprot:3069069-Alexandrium_andersonii.AAC.1